MKTWDEQGNTYDSAETEWTVRIWMEEVRQALKERPWRLSMRRDEDKRQKEIKQQVEMVEDRYGLRDGMYMAYAEVGALHGTSAQNARLIVHKALGNFGIPVPAGDSLDGRNRKTYAGKVLFLTVRNRRAVWRSEIRGEGF